MQRSASLFAYLQISRTYRFVHLGVVRVTADVWRALTNARIPSQNERALADPVSYTLSGPDACRVSWKIRGGLW